MNIYLCISIYIYIYSVKCHILIQNIIPYVIVIMVALPGAYFQTFAASHKLELVHLLVASIVGVMDL